LLWIDDYEPALAAYRAIFEKLGFRVITAFRPSIGLHLAASQRVDAVITDYEMLEMNGAAVAAELKSRYPRLPVILFTAATSLPSQVRQLADACCDKAEPLERLLVTLNRLVVKKPSQSLQPQPLRPSSERGQRTVA
jgi:DNA-binding NtrC family response regulator